MIRRLIGIIAGRFNHPLLASLYGSAVILLVVGAVAQATGRELIAGFFGVYAVIAIVLATVGYAIFLSFKFLTQYQSDRRTTGT